MRIALPLVLLLACAPDRDADGVRASADCDDVDADIGAASVWYADADADGHGGVTAGDPACTRPDGFVRLSDDCDDAIAGVNPESDESCNGRDDDCDGLVDEGGAERVLYTDVDGDSYGDPGEATLGCAATEGLSANAFDCDDHAAAVHPAGVETCNGVDDDCDGLVDDSATDAVVWFADLDHDGAGDPRDALTACVAPDDFVESAGDCDDGDDAIGPTADERCDGRDDDCDGAIDEDAVDGAPAWRDRDGDGFGDSSSPAIGCEVPAGHVPNNADCDDRDAAISPRTPWYVDADVDGFGAGSALESCVRPGSRVRVARDCDDADKAVHPGAGETCDDRDNDCDGVTDGEAAADAVRWYLDADRDGYGDPRASGRSCLSPDGFVVDASDCDDTDPVVGPGHAEVCDGQDNDCDGKIDAADPDLSGVPTWYIDADKDGHGTPIGGITTCAPPNDRVLLGDDCDDHDDHVRPGAAEVCNTVDDDCDGFIDKADPGYAGDATFFADVDGDGWGTALVTRTGCDPLPGWSVDAGDCDDAAASIHPDAVEVCGNFIDDDCDGGPGSCVLPPVIDLGAGAELPGWRGSASYEQLGESIVGVGDLDGDGLADLIVGAPDAVRPAGQIGGVYVLSSATAASPPRNADPSLAFLRGEKSYDYAGRSVGVTGDLTGDGVPELLVGATGYDAGTKSDAGAAYVVSGASRGGTALSSAYARLYGENTSDAAGYAVAGAGDVDGDGAPDIIVGAAQADDAGSNSGAAYVLLAPAPGSRSLSTSYAKLTGATDSDFAGCDVGGGGDFDGDGLSDLIVGAYNAEGSSRGAAYVVTDPPSGTSSLASAHLKLIGAAQNARTGEAVAFAGDVNGDGLSDVLVGAYDEDSAYLVFGGRSGSLNLRLADVWYYGPDFSEAGKDVAPAGDIDNDGLLDVVIGAPNAGDTQYSYDGWAFVVLDAGRAPTVDLATDADVRVMAATSYDELGTTVAGIGDADGDGLDDVAIGAFGWNNGPTYDLGAVFLLHGKGP